MAVDNFGAIKNDLETSIEDRVNALVEAELTVGGLSKMLGTLRALATVTKHIASTAREAGDIEVARARLAARPAAGENEKNQVREALAALAEHEAALAARHHALTEHLETLQSALRA